MAALSLPMSYTNRIFPTEINPAIGNVSHMVPLRCNHQMIIFRSCFHSQIFSIYSGTYISMLIYTIIAVGPLSVCVCVCLWPNSSETNGRINFIFGTHIKHTPGIVQIFLVTISESSRSSQVIEVFSFFVAM